MANKRKQSKETKALNKTYEQYKKTYARYKEKYGGFLGTKLNKSEFKEAYYEYKSFSNRPVLNMVKDSVITTENQSKVWSRNLKKHISEWSKLDKSLLNKAQIEILKLTKNAKIDKDYFRSANWSAIRLYNLLTRLDAWEMAVGS